MGYAYKIPTVNLPRSYWFLRPRSEYILDTTNPLSRRIDDLMDL